MAEAANFCVRTVTVFVSIDPSDVTSADLEKKLSDAAHAARQIEKALVDGGFVVQTVRIATSPFPEWLLSPKDSSTEVASVDDVRDRLRRIDEILDRQKIDFCSLGPADDQTSLSFCPKIVRSSPRLACSVSLSKCDVTRARAAAQSILEISKMNDGEHVQDGLGNFRFCVAAAAKDYIPFFPVAKAASGVEGIKFAVGLENGSLAAHWLGRAGSIANVHPVFRKGMADAIQPVQTICESLHVALGVEFLGIDTSLNPSLDEGGSVAAAMEHLDEIGSFGGPGSVAAAAAITESLQNLPDIKLVGYCGLMLPLCEDRRLAKLADEGELTIQSLLSISHVCGVGIDTVPIPGNCSDSELAALLLDLAGVAHRWDKSLSCRVFPVPGRHANEMTTFDFPHMVNARILPLSHRSHNSGNRMC